MKILLTGGNGQLGTDLRRALGFAELVTTTRNGEDADAALDVGDVDAVESFIRALGPDVVVNAAAYTAVDRAESEVDAALAANARGPGAMARACAATGAMLVHYSTDYVFDGASAQPYRERDATSPLGVYGRSKLEGEQAIRASGARHLILRTAWVYAMHGHNFLRTMLRLGAERDELRVVADQTGCPTPAWLIADTTARLLSRGDAMPAGTRHLVTSGTTTWHGFADAIFDEALRHGLIDRRPRLVPIATADYPTPARRPAYSVLSTDVLQTDLGEALPHWRDALALTFVNR